MSVSRFRLLVFLWVVTYGWAFSLQPAPNRLPQYLLDTSFLLLFAGVVSAIGLLFFSRFARAAFVVFTLATIAAKPFSGFKVVAPFDGTLLFIAVLLQGAVLAAAFSPPLHELFPVPAEEEEEEEEEEDAALREEDAALREEDDELVN